MAGDVTAGIATVAGGVTAAIASLVRGRSQLSTFMKAYREYAF